MGRNKAIVFDNSMVSNMIATPQHSIITNLYEWLNCVIFKNKTMITDFNITPNKSAATNVAGWLISF